MPCRVQRFFHGGARRRRLLYLFLVCAISTFVLNGAIFSVLNYVTCRLRGGQHRYEEVVEKELIQLHVIYRHGHRSPFSIFPTDPTPESFWVDGLSHLTMLGRVQHYSVGRYLRRRYSNFLTHRPQEVHCLSSGASRCLYGGYSVLAGMYPPAPNRMVDDKLHWQPIPVEYRPENDDKYLQSTNNCPKGDIEKSLMMTRPEGAAFVAKYKHLYDYWANCSGFNVINYDKASNMHRTLLLQKAMNLTIPDWAEETWEELTFQADTSYYFNFKSPIMYRLRCGPFVGRVLDKMRIRMRDPDTLKKVYLYSAHGSNISLLLHYFQRFNFKMPPFASFLTFELYKEASQRYSVRLLYTNGSNPESYVPEPHILEMPGCPEYCPFEDLEEYTRPLIPKDYEKECEIQ